jgi:hypothetical protein
VGYIEGALEMRTLPGERRVSARQGRAGEKRDVFNSLLVCGAWWFLAEPRGVLENALWAGVVDELLAADETLLHRKPAPGAEAIREVG